MTTQAGLPLGFADQVLDLQMRVEEQESLQAIQILSQMYRIAVDYYIDADVKKANYFQKKLNNLVIKSLTAQSVEAPKKQKTQLSNILKKQMNRYEQCGKTYIKTLVENNQKTQMKMKKKIEDDLNRQQLRLQGRMLRRVRSTEKLF